MPLSVLACPGRDERSRELHVATGGSRTGAALARRVFAPGAALARRVRAPARLSHGAWYASGRGSRRRVVRAPGGSRSTLGTGRGRSPGNDRPYCDA